MSEQRGLRNPDTHGTTSDGEPYCESCGVCDEGWRCRCCLAAEVEALRAREQAVRDAIEAELERHTLTNLGDFMFLDQALGRVLRALDADWEAGAAKAALRAKRDKLKKQLAEIEAQLKGAAPVTADPKKVRAWAAEQGYEVAPSGQIPKAIMADYLDATSGGAA